jgi:hypothetical protein
MIDDTDNLEKKRQELNDYISKAVFQAKDIQKFANIPKHRYEYIASKIGIRPELLEVEGTGRSHFYSFKNLLEFAFVHHANKLGLTPKAIKDMMQFISKNILLKTTGIFDFTKTTDISIHYSYSEQDINKKFRLSGPGADFGSNIYDGLTDLKILKTIEGYITINLGFIKNQVKNRILEKMD